MFSPKALLIDLDDTLFEERGYVESGFRAVAMFLEEKRDLPADYSFPSMMAFWELEGRGKIFDRIIERFEVRHAEGLVAECIEHYRGHRPSVEPYPGVRHVLEDLSRRYKLALVTNGLPLMQRHKLEALDVGGFFSEIVYCDALGAPKPAPDGLLSALAAVKTLAGDAVFVGDNPLTDGAAATAAGVPFVRVKTRRFAANVTQAPEISSITELPSLLSVK